MQDLLQNPLPRRTVLSSGLTALAITTFFPRAAFAASLDSLDRLTMSGGLVRRRGVPFRTGGINAFQLITNDYPSPRLMSYGEIDLLLNKAVELKVGIVRAHTLAASVGNQHTLVTGV